MGSWFCALGATCRPGGDLLSHVLRRSTIGAEGFHGRVRDGIGCGPLAMTTRSARRTLCAWIGNRGFVRLVRGCGAGAWDDPYARARFGFASDLAERAISTGQLRALLPFHTRPIDVMVYHGSSGSAGFEGDFPLRCFQRLFRPHLATRRCRWRDNRSTRGASIPVLSY